MQWTLTTKAVNSKPLFEEIHDFVQAGMSEVGLNWSSEAQRMSYAEMIEDYLFDLAEGEDKIEQWDVRCDNRNNKVTDMNNGHYVLDVFYKQRNCLNTTQLHYEVEEMDDVLELDLQF